MRPPRYRETHSSRKAVHLIVFEISKPIDKFLVKFVIEISNHYRFLMTKRFGSVAKFLLN